MDPKKKKMMIIGGIVFLVVLLGAYFIFAGKKSTNSASNVAVPTEVAIPTIDNSVVVNMVSTAGKKEVVLSVKNAPSGTKTIDYELSYQTAQQGLQGIIGTLEETPGSNGFEKKLTLGTCSSGTCIYHEVVGKIKVTLRFNGDYGEKIYEKEFEI